MSQTWRLKPEHTDIVFQAKDLAALFVSVTSYWYEDPQNTLYRKKAEVYNLIRYWLETGQEPENLPYQMVYALQKFQVEWYEDGRQEAMFERVVK